MLLAELANLYEVRRGTPVCSRRRFESGVALGFSVAGVIAQISVKADGC
jgi:hypothetical protein